MHVKYQNMELTILLMLVVLIMVMVMVVMGLVEVFVVIPVDSIIGFVVIVEVFFVVDLVEVLSITSSMMIMKTSEMIIFCIESTMMISTSVTVTVASGAHINEPLLGTCRAISVTITVISVAPEGTRWISTMPPASIELSHMIFCIWPIGHESPALGFIKLDDWASAERPKAKREMSVDRIVVDCRLLLESR